jgi:dipeptidyl aminopeptidase/acylaminoacyl peptidase
LYADFGLPGDVIKSCFPYSGVYDFRDMAAYGFLESQNMGLNFINSSSEYADASPITFAKKNSIPFYVTWAENDNLQAKAQAPALVTALREGSGRTESYMFPLFDHFWIHIDQQRETNRWTRTLRAWMTGDPRTAAIAAD